MNASDSTLAPGLSAPGNNDPSGLCRLLSTLATGLVLFLAATNGALAEASGPLHAASAVAPADRSGRFTYIVRFTEPSLARYEGGIDGLAATSPQVTGQRLQRQADNTLAYQAFLEVRHNDYLAQIGRLAGRSLESESRYLNVLNGVALRLSPAEAERVASLPFVAGVEPNRLITTGTGAATGQHLP